MISTSNKTWATIQNFTGHGRNLTAIPALNSIMTKRTRLLSLNAGCNQTSRATSSSSFSPTEMKQQNKTKKKNNKERKKNLFSNNETRMLHCFVLTINAFSLDNWVIRCLAHDYSNRVSSSIVITLWSSIVSCNPVVQINMSLISEARNAVTCIIVTCSSSWQNQPSRRY